MNPAGRKPLKSLPLFPSRTPANPDAGVWFRIDEEGRVFRLDEFGRDVLWLDPAGSEQAELEIVSAGGGFVSPAGVFSDVLRATARENNLRRSDWVFARGVGPVSRKTYLMTGSSGGLVSGMELQGARIEGSVDLSAPGVFLQLSLENNAVTIEPGQITNCILPCYYAACGLGGPAPDPPETFKPCLWVQASLQNTASPPVEPAPDRAFEVELRDSAGTVIFRYPDAFNNGPGQAANRCACP